MGVPKNKQKIKRNVSTKTINIQIKDESIAKNKIIFEMFLIMQYKIISNLILKCVGFEVSRPSSFEEYVDYVNKKIDYTMAYVLPEDNNSILYDIFGTTNIKW